MSDTQACMENYDHVLSGINEYDTFLHNKNLTKLHGNMDMTHCIHKEKLWPRCVWHHGYDTLQTLIKGMTKLCGIIGMAHRIHK